ncbi:IDEAL domain-containing protein [Niallia taxi]|uniref:IDEAL domain-containing protein n=1 Tax=Niallia taxi TaxID=2499688 RepID=UPI00254F6204|nr:IDEAL domain-containing protein [Niallia taxi]MDK8641316.1 IDEAL domain-containing protein [Niallia taxi]
MAQSESVFKKGEWVVLKGRYKWIGFITAISYALEEYEVHIVRKEQDNDVSFVNLSIWADFEDTELMESQLSEGNLHQLIDMALDTKDREWFLQLQSMLPKSEELRL